MHGNIGVVEKTIADTDTGFALIDPCVFALFKCALVYVSQNALCDQLATAMPDLHWRDSMLSFQTLVEKAFVTHTTWLTDTAKHEVV